MNEDEAFIRVIVDAPGDYLPRSVYADWLDDHDDPRGPYLRAERVAPGASDLGRLRELAAGLDPVWVARVSAPPMGVCGDFAWGQRGEPICGADLDRFEVRFGFTLPFQYRALLLNCNGGVIGLDPWETPDGIAHRDSCSFYSLARTSRDDPVSSLEYEFAFRRDSVFKGTPREGGLQVRLHNSMIIGTTPGQASWVLLGTGERNTGGVRSLAIPPAFGHVTTRFHEPLRFDSLADYLLSLAEYRT